MGSKVGTNAANSAGSANQATNGTQSAGQQTKQEYNQQVPVSSYYLLHGKYNSSNKGKKTQSNSAKATDLGGAVHHH